MKRLKINANSLADKINNNPDYRWAVVIIKGKARALWVDSPLTKTMIENSAPRICGVFQAKGGEITPEQIRKKVNQKTRLSNGNSYFR